MLPKRLWMLVTAAFIALTSAVVNGRHVFCYYSSFAQTRQGVGKFLPEKIDPFLCSHVIYAFVDISADGTDLKPFNRNDQGPNGLYTRTLALKNRNPDLKVLLAVGGWQIGSKPFIPMVSNQQKRKIWVKNVVKYLRRHSFDGFDVDWEFPATRGSPPEDKYRFTKMMKELYEAFSQDAQDTGKDKLLLTMATASGTFYIDQSYEPRKIIKYIDFMLLMTYNYHGQWEKTTGHHSGLYGHRDDPGAGEKSQLNQQWSIDYWLDVGISPKKLIVGIPTYGMSFTLASPSDHSVHAPAAGGGKMGDYTRETGILAYYEICLSQRNKGWHSAWIEDQAAPYTYYQDQWAGYDNARSVVLKSENIVRRDLAGAFVWSVEMDDFNGVCDEGKYPLLSAINDVINGRDRKTQAASIDERIPDTDDDNSNDDSDENVDDDDDDDDDIDNSNNNNNIKMKLKKRRRGRKILKNNFRIKSNVGLNSITTTAPPPPSSPSSSTTSQDSSTDMTTRDSLKVRWWSGTVYRKESPSSSQRNTGSQKRRGRGERGGKDAAAAGRARKMRKMRKTMMMKKKYKDTKLWSNENSQDAISNAASNDNKNGLRWASKTNEEESSNEHNKDTIALTRRPTPTPWWRRHDSNKVKVTETAQDDDKRIPKWRWNARDSRATTGRHDNEMEMASSLSPSSSSSSPPSTMFTDSPRRKLPRRMTSRRPKLSPSFSKKFHPELTTKRNTVKTAAASAADNIDCQELGAGTFPDPDSCSRFIICMPGTWLDHPPHVMYCPSGTMFDENLNICNYASRVRCPYWDGDTSS